MKHILILIAVFATSEKEIPKSSGVTEGHVEWLKEHDAYEDFMDAFYPDSSKNSL